jgi:shikimate kinase
MGRGQPEIPYRNLVLTGHLGVGKRAAGRAVATRLGVTLIEVEAEVEAQEGRSLEEIRALFGQARARALESEVCRVLALRRSAVIVASASVALSPTNRARLAADSELLCLVCDLNEVLRRLYAAMGARFHDPPARARIVARLKREWPLRQMTEIPQLDTTYISVEQAADRAIAYWRRGVQALRISASEEATF